MPQGPSEHSNVQRYQPMYHTAQYQRRVKKPAVALQWGPTSDPSVLTIDFRYREVPSLDTLRSTSLPLDRRDYNAQINAQMFTLRHCHVPNPEMNKAVRDGNTPIIRLLKGTLIEKLDPNLTSSPMVRFSVHDSHCKQDSPMLDISKVFRQSRQDDRGCGVRLGRFLAQLGRATQLFPSTFTPLTCANLSAHAHVRLNAFGQIVGTAEGSTVYIMGCGMGYVINGHQRLPRYPFR